MINKKNVLCSLLFSCLIFSVNSAKAILPGGCIVNFSPMRFQIGQQSVLQVGQIYEIDILGYSANIMYCDPKLKVLRGHVINNAPHGLECVEPSYAIDVMALEEGPVTLVYQTLDHKSENVVSEHTVHFEIVS